MNKFNFVSILSFCLFVCSNISSFADQVDTNPVVGSMFSVYTNSYGLVTTQTAIVRKDETPQKMGTNIARSVANFISTVQATGPTPDDKALAEYMFTNSTLSPITNAAFMAELLRKVASATDFLHDLKKQGRLPGVASDSHPNGSLSDLSQSDFWMSQKIKYPLLLRIDSVLSGDTLTNHYAIMQLSDSSPWKLKRAWRTDSSGGILIEWPVDNTEPTHVK